VRLLVFVLGPQRVRLSSQDVRDLNGWFREEVALAGREHLRQPLRRAIKTGEDVIVRDNDARVVLLAILDRMDVGGLIQTDGLRKLHEAARLPIVGC
jgi:hypothetical protein